MASQWRFSAVALPARSLPVLASIASSLTPVATAVIALSLVPILLRVFASRQWPPRSSKPDARDLQVCLACSPSRLALAVPLNHRGAPESRQLCLWPLLALWRCGPGRITPSQAADLRPIPRSRPPMV